MAKKKQVMRRLVKVRQSPMNAVIWNFQLDCGHEFYKTQRTRPRTHSLTKITGDVLVGPRMLPCSECTAAQKDSGTSTL